MGSSVRDGSDEGSSAGGEVAGSDVPPEVPVGAWSEADPGAPVLEAGLVGPCRAPGPVWDVGGGLSAVGRGTVGGSHGQQGSGPRSSPWPRSMQAQVS